METRILSADRFHHNFCHFRCAQFLRTVHTLSLGHASVNRIESDTSRKSFDYYLFLLGHAKSEIRSVTTPDGREGADHAIISLMHANTVADGRTVDMSILSVVVQSRLLRGCMTEAKMTSENVDGKRLWLTLSSRSTAVLPLRMSQLNSANVDFVSGISSFESSCNQ